MQRGTELKRAFAAYALTRRFTRRPLARGPYGGTTATDTSVHCHESVAPQHTLDSTCARSTCTGTLEGVDVETRRGQRNRVPDRPSERAQDEGDRRPGCRPQVCTSRSLVR